MQEIISLNNLMVIFHVRQVRVHDNHNNNTRGILHCHLYIGLPKYGKIMSISVYKTKFLIALLF